MTNICELKLTDLIELKKQDKINEKQTEIVNVKTDIFQRFQKFHENYHQNTRKRKLIDPVERSKRIYH